MGKKFKHGAKICKARSVKQVIIDDVIADRIAEMLMLVVAAHCRVESVSRSIP